MTLSELTLLRSIKNNKATQIFLLLILTYGLFAYDRLGRASTNNHFAYLAQAFLNGQTYLTEKPPHGNDWASYEVITLSSKAQVRLSEQLGRELGEVSGIYPPRLSGRAYLPTEFKTLRGEYIKILKGEIKSKTRRYFVSFPPLPALLLLPFVAIFGLATSDVWFTIFFAALNGSIALSTFRHFLSAMPNSNQEDDEKSAFWLALSLCLGTAHFWCAVRGEVWFTALILGVTCQLLFFRWAWHLRRPLLAGFAYAAAFSTRASLITLAAFAYLQVLSPKVHPNVRERVRKLAIFSLPPLGVGLSLLLYNAHRFDQWHEFGHRYLAGGQLKRIAEYGLFHWVFLKKNVIAAFALLPMFSLSAPLMTYSWHGMALQFSSPHLMLACKPAQMTDDMKGLRRGLIVVVVSTFVLLILYQNTGWVQYSWRFSLDFISALTILILIAKGAQVRLFKSLVLWGIVVNLLGALMFGRTSIWWSAVDLPKLLPH